MTYVVADFEYIEHESATLNAEQVERLEKWADYLVDTQGIDIHLVSDGLALCINWHEDFCTSPDQVSSPIQVSLREQMIGALASSRSRTECLKSRNPEEISQIERIAQTLFLASWGRQMEAYRDILHSPDTPTN